MNNADKTRTAYNFLNTCPKCFNDFELPLLGEFANGEMIFQTKDAKDFYIAVLIGNKTLDFVVDTLKQGRAFQNKELDPLKLLALVADKVDNRDFTTDFPICPFCKSRLRTFNDGDRTTQTVLRFATWTDFEKMSTESKISKLKEVSGC